MLKFNKNEIIDEHKKLVKLLTFASEKIMAYAKETNNDEHGFVGNKLRIEGEKQNKELHNYKAGGGGDIQAVLFDRRQHAPNDALKWLVARGYT